MDKEKTPRFERNPESGSAGADPLDFDGTGEEIEEIEFDDLDSTDTEEDEKPVRRTRRVEGGAPVRAREIPAIERRKKRQAEEKDLAPRPQRRKRSFPDEYGRYLLAGGLAVILVIVLILVGIRLFSGEKGPDSTESGSGSQPEPEYSSSEPAGVQEIFLEKDAVSEVNELVRTYYAALLQCDMDTLARCVEDVSRYTEESLRTQSGYIEDYRNIACYTKPGLTEGEYVLYAYSEIKFANIAKEAPQLNRYYVSRAADGSLRLANGDLSDDKLEYINEMNEDADVRQLIIDVTDRYEKALEEDSDLYAFVQMIDQVTDPGYTQEETPAGTLPPETASPETDPPSEDTFYVNGELFYAVNETVYPKEEVRVRAQNSMESDVVGKLSIGDYVTRTGYSENWSQIIYNGYTAYVYKGFLTTNPPQ